MTGKDIKIRANGGGEFDCYLVVPGGATKVPAVVLASAIHGVDGDIRALADEFAALGFIAAAPDLFWRSVPGPLVRDDVSGRQLLAWIVFFHKGFAVFETKQAAFTPRQATSGSATKAEIIAVRSANAVVE